MVTYCCVEYLNVEYQDEIFETHPFKSNAQKQMVRSGFECKFHEFWGAVFHKFVDFTLRDFKVKGRILMGAL